MMIKCNACGAETSLDAAIDNDDASTALSLALSMTPLGKLLVRYLDLFRPATRKLSWSRVASLLGELMPLIDSQRIERDGKVYEAQHQVWCSAIEKALLARDTGSLKLPLKSHGYLFEIIITEGARHDVRANGVVVWVEKTTPSNKAFSGTAQALANMERRKNRS